MFSFTKYCRNPHNYNWTFIKDTIIIALVIAILCLIVPIIMRKFGNKYNYVYI